MSFQEPIKAVYQVLPPVLGDLDFPGVHPNGILRTGLDTKSAEAAAADVNGELDWDFLDLGVRVFGGFNEDAFGGADRDAKKARDAARLAVFPPQQTMEAPMARSQLLFLLGILDRYGPFSPGLEAEDLERMEPHVGDEMTGRNQTALDDLEKIAQSFDHFRNPITTPVPTILTKLNGMRSFQPMFITWS